MSYVVKCDLHQEVIDQAVGRMRACSMLCDPDTLGLHDDGWCAVYCDQYLACFMLVTTTAFSPPVDKRTIATPPPAGAHGGGGGDHKVLIAGCVLGAVVVIAVVVLVSIGVIYRATVILIPVDSRAAPSPTFRQVQQVTYEPSRKSPARRHASSIPSQDSTAVKHSVFHVRDDSDPSDAADGTSDVTTALVHAPTSRDEPAVVPQPHQHRRCTQAHTHSTQHTSGEDRERECGAASEQGLPPHTANRVFS